MNALQRWLFHTTLFWGSLKSLGEGLGVFAWILDFHASDMSLCCSVSSTRHLRNEVGCATLEPLPCWCAIATGDLANRHYIPKHVIDARASNELRKSREIIEVFISPIIYASVIDSTLLRLHFYWDVRTESTKRYQVVAQLLTSNSWESALTETALAHKFAVLSEWMPSNGAPRLSRYRHRSSRTCGEQMWCSPMTSHSTTIDDSTLEMYIRSGATAPNVI